MSKNQDKGKDGAGAYCAAIVDRAKGTTDWRKGPRDKDEGKGDKEDKED